MKKIYQAPAVEKIKFNYRDQVVVASGIEGQSETGTGNIFQSSEFGGCYSAGDVFEYALNTLLGDCDWL